MGWGGGGGLLPPRSLGWVRRVCDCDGVQKLRVPPCGTRNRRPSSNSESKRKKKQKHAALITAEPLRILMTWLHVLKHVCWVWHRTALQGLMSVSAEQKNKCGCRVMRSDTTLTMKQKLKQERNKKNDVSKCIKIVSECVRVERLMQNHNKNGHTWELPITSTPSSATFFSF